MPTVSGVAGVFMKESTLLRKASVPVFVGTAIAVWWFLALGRPTYLFPSPLDVGNRAVQLLFDRYFLTQVLVSIAHVWVSVVLSFVSGLMIVILAYYIPVLGLAVRSRLTPFLSSFSGIGWMLIASMWFGIGSASVIFSMTAAVDNVDREIIEMQDSFTRSKGRGLIFILLPILSPFMFASIISMLGIAWTSALIAELFVGGHGLGHVINLARQEFDTAAIFVVIAIVIALVAGVNRFVLVPVRAVVFRHGG